MGEFYEIKEETDVVVDGVGSLVVDILRGFFACAKGKIMFENFIYRF